MRSLIMIILSFQFNRTFRVEFRRIMHLSNGSEEAKPANPYVTSQFGYTSTYTPY